MHTLEHKSAITGFFFLLITKRFSFSLLESYGEISSFVSYKESPAIEKQLKRRKIWNKCLHKTSHLLHFLPIAFCSSVILTASVSWPLPWKYLTKLPFPFTFLGLLLVFLLLLVMLKQRKLWWWVTKEKVKTEKSSVPPLSLHIPSPPSPPSHSRVPIRNIWGKRGQEELTILEFPDWGVTCALRATWELLPPYLPPLVERTHAHTHTHICT